MHLDVTNVRMHLDVTCEKMHLYANIHLDEQTFLIKHIVKLHSNLQTQLNFSWLEKELTLFSHGRKRKEGRKNNPHLAFSRKNDPTCLNFADCIVGV